MRAAAVTPDVVTASRDRKERRRVEGKWSYIEAATTAVEYGGKVGRGAKLGELNIEMSVHDHLVRGPRAQGFQKRRQEVFPAFHAKPTVAGDASIPEHPAPTKKHPVSSWIWSTLTALATPAGKGLR